MQDLFFLCAAALSALWCAVHLFAGGAQIAAPLRRSTALDPLVRDTQYLCWHLTTVSLATLALLFVAATATPAHGLSGTFLATAFLATGLWVAQRTGQPLSRLPQGLLFLPVALLGLAGIFAT
jgi:hypothetical protein